MSCLVLILVACSTPSGGIEVKEPWARPADAGANTAAYFEIDNGGMVDFLLSASSQIAEKTEVHRTVIQEDGAAKMEHQDKVEIPGGESVFFQPGGLHIMFINLSEPLNVGDSFDLILNFEKEGEKVINVTVQTP
jgi:copper(I)-binding protein